MEEKKERKLKMNHAKKRLQAIRQQLIQMNEDYRYAVDAVDETVIFTETEASSGNKNENAHEIGGAGGSNICYSPAIDNLEKQVSSSININIGEDIDSLEEYTTNDVAEIPLAEELRCAIFNMEDLDDVDDVIGNVMNPDVVDKSFDLEFVEQTLNLSNSSTTDERSYTPAQNKGANPLLGNSTQNLRTIKEEEKWRKDREKKDNHNIIERRRRYNINDRIKELAALLPASVPHHLKQNKGSILKASVEYMKELIREKRTLQKVKEHQKTMNSKYQKLLIRFLHLELKLNLYGLSEELNYSSFKKKKTPKKRLSEIDAIVEDHVKQFIPKILEQTPNISISPCKRTTDGSLLTKNKQKLMLPTKLNLRQHLNKKMSDGGHSSAQSNDSILEDGFTNQFQHLKKQRKEEQNSPPTHSDNLIAERSNAHNDSVSFPYTFKNDKADSAVSDEEGILELSTEQCNILLDLFENKQNENESLLNTNFLPNPTDASANLECFSPVTSTCNMLESLLRKQDTASESSATSSGLEDSTESATGLR
ncbi:uncharacterized protein LOC133193518 [Saccostrea echinata]|uniref:uncharacterized protein LOC133193518 n=1 Tax=Saccostrea echinata TaxID=191078 RepID=UPI002A831697|nr:uncharacterized protein LOC133193518 [Saccostrea echinata]